MTTISSLLSSQEPVPMIRKSLSSTSKKCLMEESYMQAMGLMMWEGLDQLTLASLLLALPI